MTIFYLDRILEGFFLINKNSKLELWFFFLGKKLELCLLVGHDLKS